MLNKTPLLHQSLGPHVCLSVCLSLSLHPANSLERRNPSCSLTFLPGLLRPSREGALCLHSLERVPGAFVSDASPVSRTSLVFWVNQGLSASLFLLLSYRQLQTTRFRSIKGPQHIFTICLFAVVLKL